MWIVTYYSIFWVVHINVTKIYKNHHRYKTMVPKTMESPINQRQKATHMITKSSQAPAEWIWLQLKVGIFNRHPNELLMSNSCIRLICRPWLVPSPFDCMRESDFDDSCGYRVQCSRVHNSVPIREKEKQKRKGKGSNKICLLHSLAWLFFRMKLDKRTNDETEL